MRIELGISYLHGLLDIFGDTKAKETVADGGADEVAKDCTPKSCDSVAADEEAQDAQVKGEKTHQTESTYT